MRSQLYVNIVILKRLPVASLFRISLRVTSGRNILRWCQFSFCSTPSGLVLFSCFYILLFDPFGVS